MLKNGMYVRLKSAPATRMGRVSERTVESGRVKFMFHHDSRFLDPTPDAFVFEDEIEECARPSNAQVKAINRGISSTRI